MARILVGDLDDHSRLVVPLILARFPEWEQFANVHPRGDGKGAVAEFNVPCPSPAAENGLWVSTADEELSVGFHTHHGHFTNYESRMHPDQIEAGLKQAADVVAERAGVVSWYGGNGFAGSRWVELPHPEPLPTLFAGLDPGGELDDLFSGCDRATLRSWFGQFDRDEARG